MSDLSMLVFCFRGHTFVVYLRTTKVHNNSVFKEFTLHSTNYGIFNIRFQGPSVWNSIDEDIKLSSLSLFKKKMKQHFIKDY